METREDDIRLTAYFLWEQDGKPQGREHDYWHLQSNVTVDRMMRTVSSCPSRRDDWRNV